MYRMSTKQLPNLSGTIHWTTSMLTLHEYQAELRQRCLGEESFDPDGAKSLSSGPVMFEEASQSFSKHAAALGSICSHFHRTALSFTVKRSCHLSHAVWQVLEAVWSVY